MIDYKNDTKVNYILTSDEVRLYDLLLKKYNLKHYEKMGILNILRYDGYRYECQCKHLRNAFKKLNDKGIIEVIDGFAYLFIHGEAYIPCCPQIRNSY